MKKQIALLTALLILVSAFAGCKKYTPELPTGEATVTEATEPASETVSVFAPTEAPGESDTAAPASEAETTAEAEQPTETPAGTTAAAETEPSSEKTGDETTAPATEAPAGPSTGAEVSAKGYPIKTVNGVTYVNGILIANKTYSLPADYAPGDLTGDVYAAYERMKSAAAEDGVELFILSGYRSYETQSNLYSRYSAADGKAAADRYSARPGHSEHQTGLAMDLNSLSQSFADTPEGKWIAEHCWDYGFILRYPKEKEAQTGYMYEPWHLRYIGGAELANDIRASGLCLEEYLGITSVYAD